MYRSLACLLALLVAAPLARAQDADGDKPFKVEGKLTDDDPKVNLIAGAQASPSKTHSFKMKKGQVYVIDMVSTKIDSFLLLKDPSGKDVAKDDDGGGFPNARILYKAPESGEYKIVATCYPWPDNNKFKYSRTGPYTLTVRKGTAEDIAKADPFSELIGKQAPDMTAEFTLNGKKKKLSDYRGKVVLVDFWAVWCGPCIKTFPHLVQWAKDHKEEGLVVVGVTTYYERFKFDKDAGRVNLLDKGEEPLNAAQEHDMVRQFAAHHKLNYPLMVVSKDAWQQASKDYRIKGIPEAVLIDREGNVRMVRVGSGEENARALEEEIKKLLREKK